MDEFEQRLKEDAASIRAQVSPELKARIASSVHATQRLRKEVDVADDSHDHRSLPWWLSGLTGLVAAVIIIALLNRNTPVDSVAPVEEQTAAVVPKFVKQLHTDFYLNAENADFTGPLENELEMLKSDLEKAKRNVAQDLKATF
jgi:hypothetical protein